jgi:tRNA(adenine34) deaminase
MDDTQAMERCIQLARDAAALGDQPYGSLIVLDGQIVAEGRNRVVTDVDPTAHAELLAIRQACRALGRIDLSGGTIYASGEPCWACSSAIRGARLSRVVIAAPSFWATGGYTSEFPILRVAGLAGVAPPPEVVIGFLEERIRAVYAEVGWPPPER